MSEMGLIFRPFCGIFMRTKRASFFALVPPFERACGASSPCLAQNVRKKCANRTPKGRNLPQTLVKRRENRYNEI